MLSVGERDYLHILFIFIIVQINILQLLIYPRIRAGHFLEAFITELNESDEENLKRKTSEVCYKVIKQGWKRHSVQDYTKNIVDLIYLQ